MADPDWAMASKTTQSDVPDWASSARTAPPVPGLLEGAIDYTDNAIQSFGSSKPVQSLKANWDEMVDNGLFMQPVRAGMEALGIGRQEGESDASLHARYGAALQSARQNAHQRAVDNQVGNYGPDASMMDRAARFAQQTGNVAAGIVANPQYFLLPGMGIGSTVAARVGTAAAGNAAIGGLSDAAAQLMDMAEGQKKDFDIQQNLANTAMGGSAGAALHGAVEVSPFVKSLFADRGRDTTPGTTPLGQTSPLTPNQIVMNPAESTRYRGLLASGSVDDIKNFFKGRQGPQPSWQDVNSWVDHRDAAQQSTTVPQHIQDTVQRLLPTDQATHVQNVTNHVNTITAGWKNAPEIEVVHSPADIADPTIRAQVTAQDPSGDAVGIYGSDGKVRLFSQNIHTPDQASAALFHEGLGHYGLDQQFGDRLNQVMTTLADRNVGQFGKAVDAYQQANPGTSRALAAEETLAEASQKGTMKPSWQQAVGTAVKQFGRKMGLKLAYSDGEVNHILAMSHDAVINGKTVRDNGFRSGQKYMRSDVLGREITNPDDLNQIDRLKASPRYWNDPEYRANVNELARTQFQPDRQNKFMTKDQFNTREDDDKPFTFQDVIDHFELKDEIDTLQRRLQNVNPDGRTAAHLREDLEEAQARHERLYGDVTHELEDAFESSQQGRGPGKAVPDQLPIYVQAGTGWRQLAETYPSRRKAFAAIDEFPNSQLYGINRLGTDNKYATREQIASTGIAREDFVPEDLAGIVTHIELNYNKAIVPLEDTKEAAFAAGIEPNDIKLLHARDPGELAARVARIGAAADYAAVKVKGILDKLDTPEWGPQDHFDLASAIADRNYLIERFKQESNEVGRALNTVKMFRSYTNGNLSDVMQQLRDTASGLADLADPTNPEGLKFARQLKEALASNSNPGKAQNLMTNVNKPYWEQYLTTFHMNMMLSALSTHVKAPIDMGTGIIRNVIEKVVAMPIGQVRQMLERVAGKTVKPGVEIAELSNHLQGMMDAVTTAEVYRQSLVALKTGQSSYVLTDKGGIGKSTPQVVPTNFANQFGAISNPRLKGVASILNKPMDAVSAQDTFFRSVEMNAQLGTLGARKAREELGPKTTTSDVISRGRYWAQNPTPTMLRDAFEETNRTLLLNDNPINRIVNRARLYRPEMNPGQRLVAWFANNLAPFIRVESNSLINRVMQRSPLALFDPTGYTQAQFRAGGTKADIAISKMVYGSVLMGMMWWAAGKGKDYLTGNGDDNVQRYKEDIAAGRVPNAVHENGQYVTGGQLGMSINPFDMHNKTAQMVAGMRQAWDSGANKGQVFTGFMMATGALFHELATGSWASDFAPVEDALMAKGESAPQQVSNFVGNEARTFVPNLSNQIARKYDVSRDINTDPNLSKGQRILETIHNTVQSAIPGLRENLPTKYSVYGNPLPTGASMTGVHTMIPGLSGNGTTETTDPAERELDRLNVILPDLKAPADQPDLPKTLVTGVSRSIKVDGQKRQLTPAEFETYQHKAGRYIVDAVRQTMSTPEWQNMSDYDRVLTVRQIESDQKANAKEELFEQ